MCRRYLVPTFLNYLNSTAAYHQLRSVIAGERRRGLQRVIVFALRKPYLRALLWPKISQPSPNTQDKAISNIDFY